MEEELLSIVTEINRLLPQLEGFISQFQAVVDTGVNVVSDAQGNMSIDVPAGVTDVDANKISTRIGIIDRLITQNGESINELFNKGLKIENSLKLKDPSYSSQLTKEITKFKALNTSYKH